MGREETKNMPGIIETGYKYFWVVLRSKSCPSFGTFPFIQRFQVPNLICNEESVKQLYNNYKWRSSFFSRMKFAVEYVEETDENSFDERLCLFGVNNLSLSLWTYFVKKCSDAWKEMKAEKRRVFKNKVSSIFKKHYNKADC